MIVLFAKHVETAMGSRICDLTIDGHSTALRADSISVAQIARPARLEVSFVFQQMARIVL